MWHVHVFARVLEKHFQRGAFAVALIGQDAFQAIAVAFCATRVKVGIVRIVIGQQAFLTSRI